MALLDAAAELAVELGGIRFVTVAAVTERANLHRTGVRRYFASKEELLLELAEQGWGRWRDAVEVAAAGRRDAGPTEVASLLATTLASMPVFCDLLAHAPMSLEGDVALERARRYKTNAFLAHDAIVTTLAGASTQTRDQLESLVGAAVVLAAGLWQVANPTPTLAVLYEQNPRWRHAAMDFLPHLEQLLRATALGLAQD